jgi:hypothetical protein
MTLNASSSVSSTLSFFTVIPDESVLQSDYGLDNWEIRVRFPAMAKYFLNSVQAHQTAYVV